MILILTPALRGLYYWYSCCWFGVWN